MGVGCKQTRSAPQGWPVPPSLPLAGSLWEPRSLFTTTLQRLTQSSLPQLRALGEPSQVLCSGNALGQRDNRQRGLSRCKRQRLADAERTPRRFRSRETRGTLSTSRPRLPPLMIQSAPGYPIRGSGWVGEACSVLRRCVYIVLHPIVHTVARNSIVFCPSVGGQEVRKMKSC